MASAREPYRSKGPLWLARCFFADEVRALYFSVFQSLDLCSKTRHRTAAEFRALQAHPHPNDQAVGRPVAAGRRRPRAACEDGSEVGGD